MRYIILKEKKLKYYKSLTPEDMKTPQGVINFDNFSCFLENVDGDKSGLQFAIGFNGNQSRKLVFKCSNKEEANSWRTEIQRHIDNSLGKKYSKSAENVNKPWRFDNISEEQFIKEADTGDILL
jgi:hypothetical protein